MTQLDSNRPQQSRNYHLDPQKALGMSLGPWVGMVPSLTSILLWGRLGMQLGMQQLKGGCSVMVFCQKVGSGNIAT